MEGITSIRESENSDENQPKPKQYTRRAVLSLLGAGAALAAIAAVSPKIAEAPVNERLQRPMEYLGAYDVHVYGKYNFRNFLWTPTTVVDAEGNNIRLPDPTYFERAHKKSKHFHSPVSTWNAPISANMGEHIGWYNPEQTAPEFGGKTVEQKPEDVLTDEELGRRGIRIVAPPNMKISLRPGMFAKGNVLESYNEGGDKKLDILITNWPDVSELGFKDERYGEYNDYFSNDMRLKVPDENLDHRKMVNYPQLTENARMRNDLAERGSYFFDGDQKVKMFESLTYSQVSEIGAGMYPKGFSERTINGAPNPYISIATGRPAESINFLNITALDGHPNNFDAQVVQFNVAEEFGVQPEQNLPLAPDQSYPSRGQFPIQTIDTYSGSVNTYTKDTIGKTLRHEMQHHKMWETNPRHDDESEIEELTMQSLDRAEAKLANGDDSDYGIVIEWEDDKGYHVVVT